MQNVRQATSVSADLPVLLGELHSHWRTLAIACAVAAAASFGASLLMPRRYTAICRILVDPPAGSDPRVSTAVSPIYLESLRTYEMFASSDNQFLLAAKKFGLRTDATPIEKLKKRILKVEVIRNTKILEISATLPDPVKAHELALYLGQEAVSLNREVARTADRELVGDAEKQASEVRQGLSRAQQLWSEAVAKGPIDQLSGELDADIELRSQFQRELATAEVDLAEAQASPAGQSRQSEFQAPQARVEKLRAQVASIDQRIGHEQALIAERSTRLNTLESQRRAAESALKNAETRLTDVRGATGYRGERLNIIDPGIVPERPSSPNVSLNVLIAVFAALVLAVLYVLLRVSSQRGLRPYD